MVVMDMGLILAAPGKRKGQSQKQSRAKTQRRQESRKEQHKPPYAETARAIENKVFIEEFF
jgi:hypothetical protein